MKNLQLKKHLMTAIAYLIPYVAASGMIMVIGNLLGGTSLDAFSTTMSLPDLLTTLGGTCLGFIPVIVSAGISYSIADKAGIAPGVVLGILCKSSGFGFIGGIISGFLVGFLTRWLLKSLKVPSWVQGLLPQLILPLIGSLVIGLAMQYVIGVPITWLTDAITGLLKTMSGNTGASVLFGLVVGILSAVDYGGPINKVVFAFSVGLLSEGQGGPIANLIQASMIAPFGLTIGYLISTATKRKLFSREEKEAIKTAFVMGVFQITEGSFPIILNDFFRITICTALGAGVSGALCGLWDISSKVPSGGFVAIPGINKPVLWLTALAIGSVVFAIALQFLKHTPEDATAGIDAGDDVSFDDLSFTEN